MALVIGVAKFAQEWAAMFIGCNKTRGKFVSRLGPVVKALGW